MLEYQNIKAFWQNFTFQTCLIKILLLKKVKNTVPQTYIIEDHIVEKIIGTFYKINYK